MYMCHVVVVEKWRVSSRDRLCNLGRLPGHVVPCADPCCHVINQDGDTSHISQTHTHSRWDEGHFEMCEK